MVTEPKEIEAIRNGMAWVVSRFKGIKAALNDVTEAAEKTDELDEASLKKLCWLLAKANVPTAFSLDALELLLEPVANRELLNLFVTSGWADAKGDEDQAPKLNYGVMAPSVLKQMAPGLSVERIASIVARHDKRIHEMLFSDRRNGSICWADESDDKRVSKFCAYLGIDLPDESFGNRRFSDIHAMKVIEWIDTVYHNHGMKSWREITGWVVASIKQVNPLTNMLKACADTEACKSMTPEERTELLDTWLLKTFPGLPDSQLVRTYSRKWLLGGAARAVDPGVFIKAMLVIVSSHHSAGKTSILRALAGDFYLSVKQNNLNDKDAQMLCHYAWLQEFEEMASFNKATVEHVKAYITTQEDKLRLPYGRTVESMARPCFYAGSANTTELLRDPTGSVRFWCVELPEGCFADFKWFHENRDKILGSAYKIWVEARECQTLEDGVVETSAARATRVDALLNLSRDEVDQLEEANKGFRQADSLESTVVDAAYKACTNRKDGMLTLPLRCTWEDLASYLGRKDGYNSVHVPAELSFVNTNRWKAILQQDGWKYTRKRVKQTENSPSEVSGNMWFAPEKYTAQFNSEEPVVSETSNVIPLKKLAL